MIKGYPIEVSFETVFDEVIPKEVTETILEARAPAKRWPLLVTSRHVVQAMVVPNLYTTAAARFLWRWRWSRDARSVRARMKAARVDQVARLRISFAKTPAFMAPSCRRGMLSQAEIQEMMRRTNCKSGGVIPEHRQRSCPRARPQPVSSRTRLAHHSYQTGPTENEISPATRSHSYRRWP